MKFVTKSESFSFVSLKNFVNFYFYFSDIRYKIWNLEKFFLKLKNFFGKRHIYLRNSLINKIQLIL